MLAAIAARGQLKFSPCPETDCGQRFSGERLTRSRQEAFRMAQCAWSILSVALAALCAGCIVTPPPAAVVAVVPPPLAAAPSNCREFRQTITIGGEAKEGWGTTCQQADGRWKVEATPMPPTAPPQVAAAPVAPVYPYYPYAYPYPYYYPAYGFPAPFFGGLVVGGRFR
jgi:hypothetical protein